MRPVVEKYGEAAVEAASLATLKYPATWIHASAEREQLGFTDSADFQFRFNA